MLTLSAAGLPVAEPLPTTTGERRSELDGRPAMLQRRLPGSHVFNPTTNQLSAVGRFLGRMHRACAGAELQLPNHPRDLSWVNTQAAAIKSYLGYDDQLLLDQSIESVTSLLGRRDVKSLPQGTLHADLFRDNVLFNEDGLSGVLDFHHASSGTLMFDLAVTANDWCTDASGELDPDRTLTLLRAYNEIRPLTEQEIWFFSGFALFAALTFWLSREIVLVPDPTGQSTPPVRTKNPKEFRNVVEHHLRRTFYIDRRHLQL